MSRSAPFVFEMVRSGPCSAEPRRWTAFGLGFGGASERSRSTLASRGLRNASGSICACGLSSGSTGTSTRTGSSALATATRQRALVTRRRLLLRQCPRLLSPLLLCLLRLHRLLLRLLLCLLLFRLLLLPLLLLPLLLLLLLLRAAAGSACALPQAPAALTWTEAYAGQAFEENKESVARSVCVTLATVIVPARLVNGSIAAAVISARACYSEKERKQQQRHHRRQW